MTTERHIKRVRADHGHSRPPQPSGRGIRPRGGRDRLQRFLGIIRLLAGGQEWPTKRLSEAFEVTERTVLRDMKALEEAGLVIRPRHRGPRGYRLVGIETGERPQLSLPEGIALLALAGQAADFGSPGESEKLAAWAAVTKVIALLPAGARLRLEELAALLAAQDAAARQWLCRQPWLPVLMEAIIGHRAILTTVAGQTDGAAPVVLTLVPQGIEAPHGTWTMRAFEIGGTAIPDVALERVVKLEFDSAAE